MSPRDIIAVALCGFDTQCESTGDPANLISLTLEKAQHEAGELVTALGTDADCLTAGSLEGRLKALDAFISEYMDVTFKAQPAAPVLRIASAEGSAES